MSAPLRCGRIGYTNDLPIFAAFDERVLEFPGTLHSGVPTQLNTMLVDDELDVSPISSAAFAAHAEKLVMLPELCIGASNEVMSVLLISREPLPALDGRTIVLTDESASGVGLLRILLERRYGIRARYRRSHKPLDAALAGEPALLIGDHAIDGRFLLQREHIYDLGELWREWTGEEIVFAVWAARKDAYETRRGEVDRSLRAMVDARTWGLQHIERVEELAQGLKPRPEGFYKAYYRALKFSLDEAARHGFAVFLRELNAIGEVERMPGLAVEIAGATG